MNLSLTPRFSEVFPMLRHPNRFSGFPQETKTAKAVQRLFVGPITQLKQGVNETVQGRSGV
jgi:hypothetical protein